jgi:peptide/nickel transport system substrate-binding protein
MPLHTRRRALAFGGAALAAPYVIRPAAAQGRTLTIAYNVNLPSWDPTVGPSAVNPTIQSIYKSVFDQYVDQNPDLSFKPGLLTSGAGTRTRRRSSSSCAREPSGTTARPSRPTTSSGR